MPVIRAWCQEAARDDPTLLDVGSGAGVPGIPLKIALPGLRATLLDATGKVICFLQQTITDLDLRSIGAVQGRAEELGRDQEWREQFDLVTARALARRRDPGVVPALRAGRRPRPGPEGGRPRRQDGARASARRRFSAGASAAPRPVDLPELPGRALVVIEKIGHTLGRYPRGGGHR